MYVFMCMFMTLTTISAVVHMYVCTYIHMYMYICMYACVCVCVCVYKYIVVQCIHIYVRARFSAAPGGLKDCRALTGRGMPLRCR